MAVTSVITNLFSGVGRIYQVLPSGAIDTFDNDLITANKILVEAVKSRIIYEAQTVDTFAFTDPNYGSTFWLNDSALAPVHDITDALEITDYLIVDTRNDLMQGDIVSGEVEVTRKSRITVIPLVPETGLTDDLTALTGDLLVGDLVILLPKGGGPTYVITIKDMDGAGVVDGNFALHNGQDITLNGTNDVCIFIKNADAIKEIARPDSALLSVAKKTLDYTGGSYYCLDPSGGAASVKTKRGLVILGGGTTLAAPWTVWGENGGDTPISHGTTLEVILDSELITDINSGTTLTIFGILIPDIYCKNYNFVVRAWYNDVDDIWESRMYVDQLKENWVNLVADAGSGEEGPVFTPNAAVIDVDSPAYGIRTIAHNENVYSTVSFTGYLLMTANVTVGDGLTLLGTAALFDWLPDGLYGVWTCAFRSPSVPANEFGICVVFIDYTEMWLRAIDGFDISIGDGIYLDPIKYNAGIVI